MTLQLKSVIEALEFLSILVKFIICCLFLGMRFFLMEVYVLKSDYLQRIITYNCVYKAFA